jgi:Arc/MetJ-type ribon-helix-helix transcriptional regulator
MQLNVPPDLEALVKKRLATGAFANAEEVIRHALEAQDAEESWTEEERRVLSAHIEEGFLQAERGELIDSDQARREIQAMKDQWLKERSPLD